jgi:hypothetical protein
MEASQLPDVIENPLRLFKPTLGLWLPTFRMSVRVKAFSICSSDSDGQPFRRTLIQSHSAEERVRTGIRLGGFGVLEVALKTFFCSPQCIRLPPRLLQIGFKLFDLIQEQQTV